MKLSNKTYDVLKWVCMIALNAIGQAYQGIASLWDLPLGQEVMQTCSIISVLLGALLGISSANYYAENIVVSYVPDDEDDEDGVG